MTAAAATALPGAGRQRLLVAALLVGAILAFFAAGGHHWLTPAQVQAHRDELVAFAGHHYAAALAGGFLLYAACAALSLPGGLVLSLSIGFLFGRWVGTAVIVCGATVGAGMAFAAIRYLFADAARRRAGPLADRINRGFSANAFNYLLFLRLTPLFPFSLVNLATALSDTPMRTFLVATGIGIVPVTFVYADLGQSMGTMVSPGDLVTWRVVAPLALLGVASLVPVFAGRIAAARVRAADRTTIKDIDNARHTSSAPAE